MGVNEADLVLLTLGRTIVGLQMLSRNCALLPIEGTRACRPPKGFKWRKGVSFSVITSRPRPSSSPDSLSPLPGNKWSQDTSPGY